MCKMMPFDVYTYTPYRYIRVICNNIVARSTFKRPPVCSIIIRLASLFGQQIIGNGAQKGKTNVCVPKEFKMSYRLVGDKITF